MNNQNENTPDDKILEDLNRQLEEEKKRQEEAKEESTEEPQEPEPKEEEEKPTKRAKPRPDAVFKDRGGRRRKATVPKKYECPNCSGTESTRADDGKTIYKHEGELLLSVHVCNDCGTRFGVVK